MLLICRGCSSQHCFLNPYFWLGILSKFRTLKKCEGGEAQSWPCCEEPLKPRISFRARGSGGECLRLLLPHPSPYPFINSNPVDPIGLPRNLEFPLWTNRLVRSSLVEAPFLLFGGEYYVNGSDSGCACAPGHQPKEVDNRKHVLYRNIPVPAPRSGSPGLAPPRG